MQLVVLALAALVAAEPEAEADAEPGKTVQQRYRGKREAGAEADVEPWGGDGGWGVENLGNGYGKDYQIR